jgi:hypothetical protein
MLEHFRRFHLDELLSFTCYTFAGAFMIGGMITIISFNILHYRGAMKRLEIECLKAEGGEMCFQVMQDEVKNRCVTVSSPY